jgi:hypothetical protein
MTSRMSVAEAATKLPELIEQINRDQITVELESDEQVVARLSPSRQPPRMPGANLAEFFSRLPLLGEDAAVFAEDVSS